MQAKPQLLVLVELGGYPNFKPLYERLGYGVTQLDSGRKALAYLKKEFPAVIVTEFNVQRDFRDRTSGLESVLAVAQGRGGTRVVVFYDTETQIQLDQLKFRFPFLEAMAYPIDPAVLEQVLRLTETCFDDQ